MKQVFKAVCDMGVNIHGHRRKQTFTISATGYEQAFEKACVRVEKRCPDFVWAKMVLKPISGPNNQRALIVQ